MDVVATIADIRAVHDTVRREGGTVGLVPTMGYFHAGHVSLMEAANSSTDHVTTTLFVNPLQFAANEDLSDYPRDLERDMAMAADAGVDVLFAPSVEEMYPHGPVLTSVEVDQLSRKLEGATRPTHFRGVATVVTKLFSIAGPCRAFFGEKDFQQLQIVRRMADDLSLPVEVVGCPIVREPDGLAMSSRNVYLTAEERNAALVLRRALDRGIAAIDAGERDPITVRSVLTAEVAAEPLATLDYAVAVDATTLDEPSVLAGEVRLLIAAQVGRPRLLDNCGLTLERD